MTDAGWDRLWKIFHDVRDAPIADRNALLERLCGNDDALQREVRELLDADHAAPDLLDRPEAIAGAAFEAPEELIGHDLGPYRLQVVLGVGGMGVVYRATQTEPIAREVAVKVVKRGMDSAEVVARFEAERRTLALMDHPNIARVFDAGTSADGRLFFVMELVEGLPMMEFCRTHELDVEQRVELLIPACRAVQHAHQKGVVHRDLKPTNIIVSVADGRPIPKIIDFGVARAVEGDDALDLTVIGGLIGTPEYMSPEQADPALDVDTRSDIYALGVTAYEVLCGARPFTVEGESATTAEILRRVREAPVEAPSRRVAESSVPGGDVDGWRRALRGDLDWVVLRALERDRTRRYAAASDLAADLERHLRSEPVMAGPPSLVYRAGKFVARHRWMIASVTAATLLMVALLVSSVIQGRRVRAALDESRAQAAKAEAVARFLTELFRSSDPAEALGEDTRVREILDRGARRIGEELDQAPEQRAALARVMAEVYGNLGFYGRAEVLARLSVELRTRALGADHPDTLSSMNDLGVWISKQERFDESRRVLEETLRRRTAVLGPDHPDTLATGQNMAAVLIEEGRLEETVTLLTDLIARQTRVFGPADTNTMTSLNGLAIAYQRLGRAAEAVPLIRQVVEVRRSELGEDHPSTLSAWSNLGTVLNAAEQSAEAAEALTTALDGRRRVLGPEHPNTLLTQQNLASVLAEEGELAEAERLLREAVDAYAGIYPENHSMVLVTRHNLARTIMRLGRFEEAVSIYQDLVRRGDEALPSTHFYRGMFRSGLGAGLVGLGRQEEAVAVLGEAVALLEELLGPDHRHTRTARERLERATS